MEEEIQLLWHLALQYLENHGTHRLAFYATLAREQSTLPTPALLNEVWLGAQKFLSTKGVVYTLFHKAIAWAESIVKYIQTSSLKIKVFPYGSPSFPAELYTVSNPPWALYVRGEEFKEVFEKPWIGVVGTRSPSPSLKSVAVPICEFLVQEKLVIASGLALGCDAIAHRVAIQNHACTVAILPLAINRIYPKEHLNLADQILEKGGLLISEYPPLENYNRKSLESSYLPRYSFIQRNRLIVVLSRALLILQGALQGGSLHTVKFAQKYGRPIYVLHPPEEVFSREFNFWQANEVLLRKGSATPIKNAGEIGMYLSKWVNLASSPSASLKGQQGSLF